MGPDDGDDDDDDEEEEEEEEEKKSIVSHRSLPVSRSSDSEPKKAVPSHA